MKLIAVLIVTLNIVIIRADISLKLSAANQFEGYSYPKPKTPFFTGNFKNFEPETTTRPAPRTTTRAPLSTPLTKVRADVFRKSEGYFYDKPSVPFELPRPTSRPEVRIFTETVPTVPSTYLPPTVAETYLPPVVTTPRTTTRTTTRRTTTTVKPKGVGRFIEKNGYEYPNQEVKLFPQPIPELPVTYLPPTQPTTPRTTTRRTTTRTTTARITIPNEGKILKKDEFEGYKYPQPEVRFDLPTPTPKVLSKVTAETVPVTYLPPTLAQTYLPPVTTPRTTTRRTTPRTTTVRTTSRPRLGDPLRKFPFEEEKKGYSYPAPEVPFTLPTPQVRKVFTAETVPVTYLPPTVPTVAETYLPPVTQRVTTTTRRPTTRTTTVRTTKSFVGRNLEKEFDGYKYPQPEVRFDLPTPTAKVTKKVIAETVPVTYLPPTVPDVTYLPPETTRRTTTTRRPTTTTRRPTTRTTTLRKTPFVGRTFEKEGYDYPTPQVRKDFTAETFPVTYLPPTVPTVAETYLPPVTQRVTTTTRRTTRTTRTTTQKPSTAKIFKKDEFEGYKYPQPEVRFDLPSPTPKVLSKVTAETVPVTYLPPTVAQTYLPPGTQRTTTTRRTTPRTTTARQTSPKQRVGIFREKDGYDYASPTPRINLKLTAETVPVTYLPPTLAQTYLPPVTTPRTTTRRTTPRTTTVRTTTPVLRSNPPEEKEEGGYKYPTPQVPFTLPSQTPSVKIFSTAQTVPVTYLPPVTTPRQTTTRRPTTTTRRTSPIPTEPQFKIIVPDGKQGYNYPTPIIPFPPPTEKVSLRTPFPTVPSTYLPPDTTRIVTTPRTTTRVTTRRTTQNPRLGNTRQRGYDNSTPRIPFPPSERNLIKDVTYLPPVTDRVTQTTPRPTTTPVLRTVPTVPSTYLPPETYLPPVSTTTTRRTTTRPITTRVTTQQTPKIKIFDEVETKEGYKYPKPSVGFPLPSETTTQRTTTRRIPVTRTNLVVEQGYDYTKPSIKTIIKESSVPVTYLPPVESTTTRRPTTTTRRTTTTTTPLPSTARLISTYLPPEEPKGYFYDKPSIPFFY